MHRAALWVVLGASFLIAAPLGAHNGEPSWLREGALDQGVFIAVSHPRVIRNPGGFEIRVVVNNVDAAGDVLVTGVRYSGRGLAPDRSERLRRRLPSHRAQLAAYRALHHRLGRAVERQAPEIESLFAERASLMTQMGSGAFVHRSRVGPDTLGAAPGELRMSVEVDLEHDGAVRTVRREVRIPIQSPLPEGSGPVRRVIRDARTGALTASETGVLGESWRAGDQHLHTVYSLDALLLSGTTSGVTGYADAARVTGLDWIVVTDHSNLNFELLGTTWYSPELFAAGEFEAAQYRSQTGFLVLNGQEMGLGAQGIFGLPAHLLAYPRSVDSTGFLPNPCSGLVFNHVNCEPEQVIVDRVNGAGGIGFIAHPFASGELAYSEWDFDNGVTGWAGFEVFNDSNGVFGEDDLKALVKWFELLAAVPAPTGGELPERDDFPTRFPVGLGNSDAHEVGLIGSTFTYCRLAETSREAVMDALVHGRCVASNGPLAFASVNGAGTGDVALVSGSANTVELTVQTTGEFGPAGDYTVVLFANGVLAGALPPSGSPDLAMTWVFENVSFDPGTRFLNLVVVSSDGRHLAITNPLWLEHD